MPLAGSLIPMFEVKKLSYRGFIAIIWHGYLFVSTEMYVMKAYLIMMKLLQLVTWGMLLFISAGCQDSSENFEKLIFEPNNISTELVEYAPSFSPSGSEFYFSRSEGSWGKGDLKSSLYFSVKKDEKWSTPELVPFSGQYDDSAPHMTFDGKTLFFISERPPGGVQETSQDIWKVERNRSGIWGKPIRLDSTINSTENEYCVRTDRNGNLYFASDREGGHGQGDLYMARKSKNTYSAPMNMGTAINSKKGEWNLEVSRGGDIIIFEASEREENLSPYGDLYISFKLDGEWTLSQNIEEINTTGSDLYPELVEDANVLYFSSSDSLSSIRTNIYHIEFGHIYDRYRTSAALLK